MLASLFFTIIASYPAHRPGSKPTLTYLFICHPCFAIELGRPPQAAKRFQFKTRRPYLFRKKSFRTVS